ncbi:TetR/AcrR family transcriptional regulator [Ketobacter nezhaii]|uniref:TetR/AcrR family transcriptional regulator n=1 Tax=Ketobacter sp. MCCC 1A13808 TaxID=2602738 RepID=UPI0018DBE09A|nr:TetR/AcrR family transcriptional regulator [Ketobacter sp. MCCC 1A13808]
MNTQSRRQREFRQREQKFVNAARDIIRRESVSNLTMDKIAELTEYAKGTVYKHFSCKEDILCGLCLDGLEHLLNQFEFSTTFPGTCRERILCLAMSYKQFTLQFPEEFDLLISCRTDNIRDKASPLRMQQLDELEQQIIDLLKNLISQAIEKDDLCLPDNMKQDDICFGLWAMTFGMLTLDRTDPTVRSLQSSDTDQLIRSQIGCLLDGYGWAPLSRNHDYDLTYNNILAFLNPAS